MNKIKVALFSALLLSYGNAADYNIIVGNGNVVQGSRNAISGNKNNLNGDQNIQVGNQTVINGKSNTIAANNQNVQGDNHVIGSYDQSQAFLPFFNQWPRPNLTQQDENLASNPPQISNSQQSNSGNFQSQNDFQKRRQQIFQIMIQKRQQMGLPIPAGFSLPPA